jgi:hypothetical protein
MTAGKNGSVRPLAGKRTPKRFVRRKYRRAPVYTSAYIRLLLTRYASGLLSPFKCANCGALALDPIGRTSKHTWLCDSCSC